MRVPIEIDLKNFSVFDWFGSASRTLPTTDLYFLNACRAWLNRSPFDSAPIKREGANSFSCGDVIIVCRRDTDCVVNRLLQQNSKRIFYVIDDDLEAAEGDPTLPEDYRRRLKDLREGQHNTLIKRAETVVVSSLNLSENYRKMGCQVVVLDPFWSEPFGDNRHFDETEEGAPLEIGYLGSASHAADRIFVLQIFEQLVLQGGKFNLTIIGDTEIPERLRCHPNLRVLKPLPWARYRKRLRNLRFHLALYPTLATRFNAARSLNKIIEHSVLGSVGIYSEDWQYGDLVKKNDAGFLAPNSVREWVDLIRKQPLSKLREIQTICNQTAKDLNNKERQQKFWIRNVLEKVS